MNTANDTPGSAGAYPARWWSRLDDGRLQCDLCPRECRLHEGQRGLCFVRGRLNDAMVLTTYGRSSGFCVDPIEKKPLYHFYPGTSILSFGTAGCNLACKFCQNWDISKSREMDRLQDAASPQRIAEAARATEAPSVAFTYNDPIIFAEYAMDTADACHALGIRTVAVTAGYIHDQPRREFFAKMDAANIDLKAFTDEFYVQQTGSHMATVLDTLQYVHQETDCWLEITTLLIPGLNDSSSELERMTRWIAEHLGAQVPIHFSAFHPAWKLNDIERTPIETLRRARSIAMSNGLDFVYTGNVHDREGGTSYCSRCRDPLIERDWGHIVSYVLDGSGACPHCGTKLVGRIGPQPGQFGRQRIPVRVAE